MRAKANLSTIDPVKAWIECIKPVFAREFIFMNNYEQFATLIQDHFILTSDQWEVVLNEWEAKEYQLNGGINKMK